MMLLAAGAGRMNSIRNQDAEDHQLELMQSGERLADVYLSLGYKTHASDPVRHLRAAHNLSALQCCRAD